jgi:antibiotic biosynthesis monooxygenase
MRRSFTLTASVLSLAFIAGMAFPNEPPLQQTTPVPRYLRVSTARWNIDLYSPEAERIFRQIETDGVAVFRAQPGFIRYRLMRADSTTTVAVAEWESEKLGQAGAEQYRAWMRRVGIMDRIILETRAGDIVAGS